MACVQIPPRIVSHVFFLPPNVSHRCLPVFFLDKYPDIQKQMIPLSTSGKKIKQLNLFVIPD